MDKEPDASWESLRIAQEVRKLCMMQLRQMEVELKRESDDGRPESEIQVGSKVMLEINHPVLGLCRKLPKQYDVILKSEITSPGYMPCPC